jgi:hypothetical protein
MGGTVGNTNSADGKRYRKALERALAHAAGSVEDGLFAVAKARVAKAIDGDPDASREIADRFDGKPVQQIDANLTGSLTGILESLPSVPAGTNPPVA